MSLARERPSFQEICDALEHLEPNEGFGLRSEERVVVTIVGDVFTADGSIIPIRIRDMSPSGFGIFHYGPLEKGEVTLKLSVNTYRVNVRWCVPCKSSTNNLHMSGGSILGIVPVAPKDL